MVTRQQGIPVCAGPAVGEFFREWLVCGPFPNPLPAGITEYRHDSTSLGFYRDYLVELGGEERIQPVEGMRVRRPDGGLVKLRRIRQYFLQIALDDVFPPGDSSVAYAACVVRADKGEGLVLAVSSNDGIRIWQSDALILDRSLPGLGGAAVLDEPTASARAGLSSLKIHEDPN